jgi:peptide/nickel transport system substrate-binding protein
MAILPPQLYAQDPARSVTIVLPEALQTVEPCQSAVSTVGRVIKQNVTETLTEIDPDTGTINRRLATSWERLSDDTWRLKLREGVKFHDGAAFNADAVVYSINRTMDTTLTCMVRNKYFGKVKFSFKATPIRSTSPPIQRSRSCRRCSAP